MFDLRKPFGCFLREREFCANVSGKIVLLMSVSVNASASEKDLRERERS